MLTSAILLAIQLLPVILQGVGVISPDMSALITDLGASIPKLITSLATPGATVPDETVTVLNGLRAELGVLQTTTNLDLQKLQAVSTLLESIDDALAAYQAGQTIDNPSTLQPLPVNV